ncbi:unnamed protein product [marine sediment metagenome]|uniref:Uncharacterized protein n=1 Tax=marine sediment metagenome TaxID=412755 RepID=X0Y1P8_9ZZZZ
MTRSGIRRRVLLAVLALPLLTTGTCLDMAQESVIDGFFDAGTAVRMIGTVIDITEREPAQEATTSGRTWRMEDECHLGEVTAR